MKKNVIVLFAVLFFNKITAQSLGFRTGLYLKPDNEVCEIEIGGAAEEAGLKIGDIILKINKTKITSNETWGFLEKIKLLPTGNKITIRDGCCSEKVIIINMKNNYDPSKPRQLCTEGDCKNGYGKLNSYKIDGAEENKPNDIYSYSFSYFGQFKDGKCTERVELNLTADILVF